MCTPSWITGAYFVWLDIFVQASKDRRIPKWSIFLANFCIHNQHAALMKFLPPRFILFLRQSPPRYPTCVTRARCGYGQTGRFNTPSLSAFRRLNFHNILACVNQTDIMVKFYQNGSKSNNLKNKLNLDNQNSQDDVFRRVADPVGFQTTNVRSFFK